MRKLPASFLSGRDAALRRPHISRELADSAARCPYHYVWITPVWKCALGIGRETY
jgi:hypothetical protein